MANQKQVATKAAPETAQAAVAGEKRLSLVRQFAATYGVEDSKLLSTLKETAFRQSKKDGAVVEVSDAQMMALLVVANEYKLNPFTREIYAFPDKGGIVPIVSLDGWIRIINERPELRSIEFAYSDEGTEDHWCECTITRADRSAPIAVREFYKECYRDTGPWNSHPRRMLRHKALIQCARVAFGFAGVYDPDEAERIREARTVEGEVVSLKSGTQAPRAIEAPKVEGVSTSVPALISEDMQKVLRNRLEQYSVPESRLLAHFEIGALEELTFDQVNGAYDWIATEDAAP